MWPLVCKVIILNVSPESGLHGLKFSLNIVVMLLIITSFLMTYSSCNLEKKSSHTKRPLVCESFKQHKIPYNFRKTIFFCVFSSSLKNSNNNLLRSCFVFKTICFAFQKTVCIAWEGELRDEPNNGCEGHYLNYMYLLYLFSKKSYTISFETWKVYIKHR